MMAMIIINAVTCGVSQNSQQNVRCGDNAVNSAPQLQALYQCVKPPICPSGHR